jgi:hypothetical protein
VLRQGAPIDARSLYVLMQRLPATCECFDRDTSRKRLVVFLLRYAYLAVE